MSDAKNIVPEVPDHTMSIGQLLKLSAAAYKGSFRVGLQLFLLPCAILAVSDLPNAFLATWGDVFNPTEMLKAGAAVLVVFFGWTFFILGGVVRTLSLRRMVLVPEDGYAASIAYANRIGWKSIVTRIATGALQLLVANVFLIGWIAVFVRDIGASPMGAIQAAFHQVPAIVGVAVCVGLTYVFWFYTEFWYACFSTQLAIEDSSWDSLISQAFKMSKSAFWRGCNFFFALQFVFGVGAYFLSPLTLYNLPTLLSFDIEAFASLPRPLTLMVADTGTTLLTHLLFLPFVAICSAYFVNDVRLRFQAKDKQSV